MTDVTKQFDLPPWVRVRQVHGSGYFLEDERGRWFAFARRDWQVPILFELMAGVVAGLYAACPGSDPSGPLCRHPSPAAPGDA